MNVQALLAPVVRPIMRRGIAMRASQFERLPARPGRIVFLGDSITQGGAWDEWFPDLLTLNRGIGGDTVGGVRVRLGSALNRPVAVSLLIGTNDLGGMGRSRAVAEIAAQMGQLIAEIGKMAPDAALLVNSVLPRTRRMAPTIRDLNERCARIVADAGATYVDLWPVLAGGDGSLRKELTADHVHLNGDGYAAWVRVLRPLLEAAAVSR